MFFVGVVTRTFTGVHSDFRGGPPGQVITNLAGDGSVETIADSITNKQRFYRVMTQ